MKVALLYSSQHGRTRKVVEEAMRQLELQPDVFDVKEGPSPEALRDYAVLMFFSPTYGDEELQHDMEEFLRKLSLDLTGKSFVACELGNYYGYDNFSFGALHIMRRRLLGLNGHELCEPLSLDSLPKVNWDQLSRWVAKVNLSLKSHAGC